MSWLDHYMAVPFQHGGRSLDGCDCVGLLALIIANEAHAEFPEFAARFDGDKRDIVRRLEAEMMSGRWIKVAAGRGEDVKLLVRKFDAVLMSAHVHREDGSVHSAEMHVGCAIERGRVVHIEQDVGSPVCVPLDDAEISSRVRSVWRLKALAA